jgi:hypothetical protein
MGITAVLESAIALSFVFLLLSLLITAANELISSFLGLRAKTLKAGIRTMLGGDAKAAEGMLKHPLIELATKKASKDGPSYMDREYFSRILCDYISSGGKYAVLGAHYVQGFDLQAAIENSALPDEVRALVASFAKAAGNDIKAFMEEISTWFDRTMERVYGWYSRMMRWISFGLGLAIAIGANIDSIALATSFTTDDSARSAIADRAIAFIKDVKPEELSPDKAALSEKLKASLSTEVDKLANTGVIGWGTGIKLFAIGPNSCPGVGDVLLKILGFLTTAVAASMGAPFWFDALGRLANIRSSLQPSAKATASAQDSAEPKEQGVAG